MRIDGFGQKKARICIPLSTPLYSGLSLYKRRYHLSPPGLATVNPVVLTGVKRWAGLNENKEVSFSKTSWTIELCLSIQVCKRRKFMPCVPKMQIALLPIQRKIKFNVIDTFIRVLVFFLFLFCFGFLHHCHCKTTPIHLHPVLHPITFCYIRSAVVLLGLQAYAFSLFNILIDYHNI